VAVAVVAVAVVVHHALPTNGNISMTLVSARAEMTYVFGQEFLILIKIASVWTPDTATYNVPTEASIARYIGLAKKARVGNMKL
jgi:hypothetical protein